MSSKNQKSTIDPVVIIMFGVVFLAISFALLLFQSQGANGIAIASSSSTWGQIVVAFVTGITTGGLSCLAVQGGLLASSLAHQIEQDYLEQSALQKKRGNKKIQPQKRSNSALPILLFLIAKLVAYTLLGVLLGW